MQSHSLKGHSPCFGFRSFCISSMIPTALGSLYLVKLCIPLYAAFLSVHGIFVTSQHYSKFFCQNKWDSWGPLDFLHLSTWENCGTFHKTAFPVSLLYYCRFFWVWHKPTRCPLTPLTVTLSPLQPTLVRLHHCEATSPFVWILWISSPPTFGWNLDSTVALI